MSQLVKNYSEALQAIYAHVKFEPDWVVYPFEDLTDMFWQLDDTDIRFAKTEKELEAQTGEHYYEASIVKQRFYKKWVYEGEELIMVFATQNVDGMNYFYLFSNSNKR